MRTPAETGVNFRWLPARGSPPAGGRGLGAAPGGEGGRRWGLGRGPRPGDPESGRAARSPARLSRPPAPRALPRPTARLPASSWTRTAWEPRPGPSGAPGSRELGAAAQGEVPGRPRTCCKAAAVWAVRRALPTGGGATEPRAHPQRPRRGFVSSAPATARAPSALRPPRAAVGAGRSGSAPARAGPGARLRGPGWRGWHGGPLGSGSRPPPSALCP